jgi:BirA family biotin operon repressor/biotin-[acetyl-CoA-carboxylase] ligase
MGQATLARWPDLSGARVRAALAQAGLAHPVVWFDSVGSTNDEARNLLTKGAMDGTIVLADEQTAGRGRLDRSWYSPPGSGLWLSLIFPPDLAPDQTPWLAMITGLAAAEGVEQVTGLRPVLKWPNDLLLANPATGETGYRKVAGILTELSFQDSRVEAVIVGLGLNVNTDFRHQPELASRATSLATVSGHPVDRTELLVAILSRLDVRYQAVRAGQSPAPDWAGRLVTIGQPVRVRMGPDLVEGQAEGVDPDGALRLRQSDGRVIRVIAGDVERDA